MKGIISKKATLAAAVMTATLGLAATTASADSLLAPLIINTTAGTASAPYAVGPVSTYLNIKVKGANKFNLMGKPQDPLHYVWIKKGTSVASLGNLGKPCQMINNNGLVSANDMVFQDTNVRANTLPSGLAAPDERSMPNAYTAGDFVGMVVVSDSSNTGTKGSGDPEGDMSGFGYIVDGASGDVVAYKLLNNHHSATDGDFSAGFTSKKVVDFAWMSSVGAGRGVATGWTAVVTGPDMSQHANAFSDKYDATVKFSQTTHPDGTQDSPLINGQAGVFNNDEGFTSANPKLTVTCMGSFTRATLLGGDPQLLADTKNGGWMRMSIAPVTGPAVGPAFSHRATGAVVYRDDVINAGGAHASPLGQHTMQVETSGHLAKGANHANRPY